MVFISSRAFCICQSFFCKVTPSIITCSLTPTYLSTTQFGIWEFKFPYTTEFLSFPRVMLNSTRSINVPGDPLLYRMAMSIAFCSVGLNNFVRDEFLTNYCISRHLALAIMQAKNIWPGDSILMAHLGQTLFLTFHFRALLLLKELGCIILHANILVTLRVQPRHKSLQCLI